MRPLGVTLGAALGALAMTLPAAAVKAQAPPTAAKVDTQPIELTDPARFRVPTVLEPVRRVTLVAADDGVVRTQDAREGADVRALQEVARLDTTEALARLKIASAELKEAQTAAEIVGIAPKGVTPKPLQVQMQAKIEGAQARVELARAALDRCTLRAPFAGRVLASFVSDGQYVAKGTVIAELADVSGLRVLVPVARAAAAPGAAVSLTVEGQTVPGRVQALVPLPESLAVLRELATPITGAWVSVSNTAGQFEPGQRVLGPAVPGGPVASVPAPAVKNADGKDGPPTVQVIRNEYVTDVPVRVLGSLGAERVQVTGALRSSDALIVSTSVPLLPGTLIRFQGTSTSAGAVEPTTPNPDVAGTSATVAPPAADSRPRPATRPAPAPAPGAGATKPAARPGAPSVPF